MTVEYSPTFYDATGPGSARSAQEIVPLVLDFVQPASVVDVGCGTGTWLAAFEALSGCRVAGLDGPWVEQKALQIDPAHFRTVDLTKPFPSGERFDLVVSLEVGEHLPDESAETFVRSLTSLGDVVLFSAAVPYQGGTFHINERWTSYWVEKFDEAGYRSIDCLRPRLLPNPRLEFCYAQNMFFAANAQGLARWPSLAEAAAARPEAPADLVHPRLFLQSTAFAKGPLELLQGCLGAVRDKWLVPARRKEARRLASRSRWPHKPNR